MNELPPWLRVSQTMGISIFILGLINYLAGLPLSPRLDQVAFTLSAIALLRIERGGDRGQ